MIAASWTPAAAQTAPTASSVSFTHTYDADNRRIGQAVTDNSWLLYPAGASSTAYTANSLNQYTAVGTASPAYDGDGNLTSDGTLTYGYDAESRLTSVKQGATTLGAYAYDAQGRRKSKTAGGATTIFVTDADNREVLEYDGSSGAAQRWYAYGPGPNAVLNQMNAAAGTRATLIPDIQGSVIGSLDSGGTLTKIGYQPFGENPGLTSGGFRYTGQRQDPETAGSTSQPSGLYYYRSRMYSPGWGRFLQPDTIGYGGGPNLYAYVGNDPLNVVDPTGEIVQWVYYTGTETLANQAQAYLLQSPHYQVIYSTLANSTRIYTFAIEPSGYQPTNPDTYDYSSNVVRVDLTAALQLRTGGVESVALGLAYEASHAAQEDKIGQAAFTASMATPQSIEYIGSEMVITRGTPPEELRTTTEVDQIANDLGEPTRTFFTNGESNISVSDPTYHTPVSDIQADNPK